MPTPEAKQPKAPPPRSGRPAAAVILTRGSGNDTEVFLVDRAPELRFFGGFAALPGGVRSSGDGADADPGGAARPGAPLADEHRDLIPLRRCAARELFEETGVLLPPWGDVPPEARQALRTQLLEAERPGARDPEKTARAQQAWAELASEGGGDPGEAALRDVARIATPAFSPVRYDTVFFHCPLPAGEQPAIEPGELVGGRFWRPTDALAAWNRGEILLVPPVVIALEHMVASGGEPEQWIPALDATARSYLGGRLHRARFVPDIVLAPVRTPTIPPATTTNCYLIGNQQLWILDPGSPERGEQERLQELIQEMAREGHQPTGILVSHHHPDHVGGVAALADATGLPVHAHQLTLDRLPQPCRDMRPIQDGDRFPLGTSPDGQGPWHLTALHTPGHDRGHLVFQEDRYHATLAADLASTVSTIMVDPPEGDLAHYLDSLNRLLSLPDGMLHPAHGPAVRSGHKLIKHFIRHRSQRETRLLEVLQRMGPAPLETMLPEVYWDTQPQQFPFAARSLPANLLKLEGEGRVSRPGTGDSGPWKLT